MRRVNRAAECRGVLGGRAPSRDRGVAAAGELQRLRTLLLQPGQQVLTAHPTRQADRGLGMPDRLLTGLHLEGGAQRCDDYLERRACVDFVAGPPDVMGQSAEVGLIELTQRRRDSGMHAAPGDGGQFVVCDLGKQRVRHPVAHTGVAELLHEQAAVAQPFHAAQQLRLTGE